MVHGGTIMSILSAYGLPRAPFYDWMVEPTWIFFAYYTRSLDAFHGSGSI